jgi:hypothetical protein
MNIDRGVNGPRLMAAILAACLTEMVVMCLTETVHVEREVPEMMVHV